MAKTAFTTYRICKFFLAVSLINVLVCGGSVSALDGANCPAGPENIVDFNLLEVIQCAVPPGTDPVQEFVICHMLLPQIIDDLLKTEHLMDSMFVGYREDLPAEYLKTLNTISIQVRFDFIDGPGGFFAIGGPLFFQVHPDSGAPEWVLTGAAELSLDIDDVEALIARNRLVDVALHGAIHALGMPSAFEFVGLIGASDKMGSINYLGIDGGGFGLSEFRLESDNPFAEFIPLTQNDHPGVHFSPLEPNFVIPNLSLREVITPTNQSPCARAFVSRSLRGIFADLGFRMAGINAPGIIDLDGDGNDDDPLIVNPDAKYEPVLLGDIDGNGIINLADISPFVALLTERTVVCEADFNLDGLVDLMDVQPFVDALIR